MALSTAFVTTVTLTSGKPPSLGTVAMTIDSLSAASDFVQFNGGAFLESCALAAALFLGIGLRPGGRGHPRVAAIIVVAEAVLLMTRR